MLGRRGGASRGREGKDSPEGGNRQQGAGPGALKTPSPGRGGDAPRPPTLRRRRRGRWQGPRGG